ncbi:MAG: 5'-methylthioadenosine/adenosylhomocysteine nucleosidase [Clostridia bacterium]|nr:5'-methylthioadenosine/adenosylhomocysteine nucleosidase [Clostridia bacterium]
MKRTGIIVAMKEELEEILKIMKNIIKKEIYNIQYFEGNINATDIIIVESGVGKVNAARITQILIDKLDVKEIINVGSAGALNEELNIGDIVIANKLVQHDFDITAFNHNKGYITGVGDYIESDKILIEKFKNSADKIENGTYKIKLGTIASGDIFCTDVKMKDKIREKFNAECIEMEGAAIAQVCYLDKIPFIVIRSISDTPNGNNAIIFDEFVKLASKRCSEILINFF